MPISSQWKMQHEMSVFLFESETQTKRLWNRHQTAIETAIAIPSGNLTPSAYDATSSFRFMFLCHHSHSQLSSCRLCRPVTIEHYQRKTLCCSMIGFSLELIESSRAESSRVAFDASVHINTSLQSHYIHHYICSIAPIARWWSLCMRAEDCEWKCNCHHPLPIIHHGPRQDG